MSRTEQLFEAEALLRLRAVQAADHYQRPANVDANDARRNLRAAAVAYAKLANEVDECFDGVEAST